MPHNLLARRQLVVRLALSMLVVSLAITMALVLWQQSQLHPSSYGVDFGDYHAAARRILAGQGPYAPEMLSGPIPALGLDRYRYPPVLAQLLTPLADWPVRLAATAWLFLQIACLVAALWLVARRRGWRIDPLVLGLGLFGSLAVWSDLLQGNVAGPMALLVALLLVAGPAIAGGAAVALVLLKVSPILLLPAILLRGRRAWLGASVFALAVGGVSFLLTPGAWRDYAVVLPNLLAGGVNYSNNMAPAGYLAFFGMPEPWVSTIRFATIGIAGIALLLSLRLARRSDGTVAALVCGLTATLLAPATIWQHYFVALLPVMAWVWADARPRVRASLACGWFLISAAISPAGIPLGWLGAVLVVGSLLVAAWPGRSLARA